jgi:hypothetical protein
VRQDLQDLGLQSAWAGNGPEEMKISISVVERSRLGFESTSFAVRFRSSGVESEKKKQTRQEMGCNRRKNQVVAEVHSQIPKVGHLVGVLSCRRR